MRAVRLVVLGAPAVGKTSLIEVLSSHAVHPLTSRSDHPGHVYRLSVLFEGHICHLTLIEMPPAACHRPDSPAPTAVMPKLATADACLILFDLTSPDSFQFVKLLRDQFFESRSHRIPVFVVGNKADCLPATQNLRPHSAASAPHTDQHQHHYYSHQEFPVAFKDLAALVRKQWKWSYIEVSALCDWHVRCLFQRVLVALSHTRLHDQQQQHQQPPHHQSHSDSKSLTRPTDTLRSSPSSSSTSSACHIL